eukprot:312331-Rhodomonas_salina.1
MVAPYPILLRLYPILLPRYPILLPLYPIILCSLPYPPTHHTLSSYAPYPLLHVHGTELGYAAMLRYFLGTELAYGATGLSYAAMRRGSGSCRTDILT